MINVAIDGPAGAGKSTVAKAVAKELELTYLDTGAMYRAVAYFAISNGIDVADEPKIAQMLDGLKMDISFEDGVQQIYVNGVNTTPHLREHYMSKAASDVSALPCVRYKLVELQRQFAAERDVVLDGRDIGTFVLPNANCKLFLTASPEVRARRRCDELEAKGQHVDFEDMLRDINQRDYNDSHREVAPLKQADDALFIDTTDMSIEEVVAEVKAKVAATEKLEQTHFTKKQLRWRKRLEKFYKPIKHYGAYRFIRFLIAPFIKFMWPTTVIHGERVKEAKGPTVVTLNHYTAEDSLIPCSHLFKKEAHILAKAELFRNPIHGRFLYNMGAIPVKRGEADTKSFDSTMSVLMQGKTLLIYPEGTRNRKGTKELGRLHSGAARFAIKAHATVIPMMFDGPAKPFKRTYLYVGEPFTLEEFYDDRGADFTQATQKIREHMLEVRRLVDEYVEQVNAKKHKRAKK